MEGLSARSSFKTGDVVNKCFLLGRRLGAGAFGDSFQATYEIEDETHQCAIKFEKANASRLFLALETQCLQDLSGAPHFPRFITCGKHDDYYFLVMELMGQNLLQIINRAPPYRFSIPTIIKIGLQAVEALQTLHSLNYVHRDIKPENFLIGSNPDTANQIYLIDFGLCKQLISKEQMEQFKNYPRHLRGTLRYCSTHAQSGLEIGRHDDLISLFYMLAELAIGGLPWSHMSDQQEVLELKIAYLDNRLFGQFPKQFQEIFEYLQTLSYYDTPDYAKITRLLEQAGERFHITPQTTFDWESPKPRRQSSTSSLSKASQFTPRRNSFQTIQPNVHQSSPDLSRSFRQSTLNSVESSSQISFPSSPNTTQVHNFRLNSPSQHRIFLRQNSINNAPWGKTTEPVFVDGHGSTYSPRVPMQKMSLFKPCTVSSLSRVQTQQDSPATECLSPSTNGNQSTPLLNRNFSHLKTPNRGKTSYQLPGTKSPANSNTYLSHSTTNINDALSSPSPSFCTFSPNGVDTSEAVLNQSSAATSALQGYQYGNPPVHFPFGSIGPKKITSEESLEKIFQDDNTEGDNQKGRYKMEDQSENTMFLLLHSSDPHSLADLPSHSVLDNCNSSENDSRESDAPIPNLHQSKVVPSSGQSNISPKSRLDQVQQEQEHRAGVPVVADDDHCSCTIF
ncbi:putative Tau-tubulin kinase [Blattamonas nauphoetae]|uniref:non-specific serine/threonine protein kinase n=1 Tax=Blattamonas nauphoetae TaxID=2049346 RepID=A0ABQ9YHX8_9EUKA|nr:putative Tau-tubulin kinase [Blattamonas nauphoetae]